LTTTNSKKRGELKTLLLQIRSNPQVCREEHQSFCDYTGLDAKQIDIFNIFRDGDPTFSILDGYDALFVGGSSSANVLLPDTYPFLTSCQALLRTCMDRKFPVFASCFGFQLAVLALGGEVENDGPDFEMGSLPIRLLPAVKTDLLFCDMPDPFLAIAVHRQFSRHVPSGCIELARTTQCCHAFRVADRPFWAFQFHPEVDKPRMVERLTVYRHTYTDDRAHLDHVLAAACETPDANGLLKKFVDRVLLNEQVLNC